MSILSISDCMGENIAIPNTLLYQKHSRANFVISDNLTELCPVSIIPLPFFVPVSRCRFCKPLPLPLPLRILLPYGTEFSYVIFTDQRNFTTAERRNGNGKTATEWWKPGIMLDLDDLPDTLCRCHWNKPKQLVAIQLCHMLPLPFSFTCN